MSKKVSNLFATEEEKSAADEYTGNIQNQYLEKFNIIDRQMLDEIHDAFLAGAVYARTEQTRLAEQTRVTTTEETTEVL